MLLGRLARDPEAQVDIAEGSMVFADVSGFTRLSERLARKGKEGAEHLVDAINACFSALLGHPYVLGGSLLKFGGDAMLLWFSGEDHAPRACASAVAMRRELRDVGRIRAGSTDIVLRMSVGVHSGSYAMFLVGGSHRELLVGGPATSTVVELEGAASAGQILISEATARLVPRACAGASTGPGLLLARAPACTYAAPVEPSQPAEHLIADCLPGTVRAYLLSRHAAPEHRTAVIAFLQFRGLDHLLATERTDLSRRATRRARSHRPGGVRALRRDVSRLRHRRGRGQDPPQRRRAACGRR
jgi:class 3 adenylate cyclase